MTGLIRRSRWITLVLLVLIGRSESQEELSTVANSSSHRLWIVNNLGVDSSTCGSYTTPCRSISQAIANASDGDSISVGPGQYGDLSGKGTFTGTGDERPGYLMTNGFATYCMVCIDKALQITSAAGAQVTVIQGNLVSSELPAVVGIEHDGVTFGSTGHGFTLTGGVAGVAIVERCTDFHAPVFVAGNTDLKDRAGFAFWGASQDISGDCLKGGTRIGLQANTAIGNQYWGFVVYPNEFPGITALQDNVAMGDPAAAAITGYGSIGFFVNPGNLDGDPAFSAGNVSVLNNVAIHNQYGFWLQAPFIVEFNTASNNVGAGFVMDADYGYTGPSPPPKNDHAFTIFRSNASIGNRGPGVIVLDEPGIGAGFADFSHNDFFGNDRDRTASLGIFGLTLGPSAHCGILNTGFTSGIDTAPPHAVGGKLSSLYDYWGNPAGPKAQGQGDEVGGACDLNGAVTTAVPFAKSVWIIKSLP